MANKKMKKKISASLVMRENKLKPQQCITTGVSQNDSKERTGLSDKVVGQLGINLCLDLPPQF